MVTNMVDINPSMSIIALNISGLNTLKDRDCQIGLKVKIHCVQIALYI